MSPTTQGMSLHRKLLAVIMATTLLALLLAAGAFYLYDRTTFRQKIADDTSTLADSVKQTVATTAMSFNDPELAEQILAGLESNPRLQSAVHSEPWSHLSSQELVSAQSTSQVEPLSHLMSLHSSAPVQSTPHSLLSHSSLQSPVVPEQSSPHDEPSLHSNLSHLAE